MFIPNIYICCLQVAAYDFVLPVTINAVGAPTPSQTPVPPTPAPSNKNTIHNIINPKPIPVTIATPKKRVIATALRQPIQISNSNVQFTLHSDYYEAAADGSINHSQLKVSLSQTRHLELLPHASALCGKKTGWINSRSGNNDSTLSDDSI